MGLAVCAGPALGDEGGVPFWLSGQYASFAAVPATPGWAVTFLPFYYDVGSSGGRAFPRGGQISAKLDAQTFLMITQVNYAPETKILGGQLNLGLGFFPGVGGAQATGAAFIGGSSIQRNLSQSTEGFGDLYPIASLAWNNDANNFMTYVTGDIPVGQYNAPNLINLGIGHGAIDAGGAYTYLDMQTGHEFSATAGATFNFQNPSTDYTNGVDLHLDWAASQFLNQQWHVGVVGYVYEQVSPDRYPTSGLVGAARARVLGSFESGVASVGPQVGYFFPLGKKQAYFNVRGYWEFWAQNRVKGEALYATVSLPLGN